MSDKPIFIDYDTETELAELKSYFEELTDKTLYPAQLENIILNIIEYKASLLVEKFNNAALLNLPQFSRYPILDFIGESVDCTRLKAEKGKDTLKIELFEAMNFDLTIPKGLEVLTKDEKYTFVTTENVTITAGQTVATVEIESQTATSDVNNYGTGDINILVKPESYIKSVTNLNGVTGGYDEESNENYIKRILLAPEGFSCAGSKKAYIYHTLSAHSSILDAQADSPQIPATIEYDNTTYTETDGEIESEDFSAIFDYKTGKCILTVGDDTYTITIPPQSTVYVYPLTADDETPQTILSAVENKINGDEINPMCDVVIAQSPVKTTKAITLNVSVKADADFEKTLAQVTAVANDYKTAIRKKLKAEIEPSHITTPIGNIGGVYSVDTGTLTTTQADINEFFDITFTINATQRI